MKKVKIILGSLILAVVLISIVVICAGTSDFKTGIQGTWRLYHYYERAEDGLDVFLDESNYWIITVGEGTFEITAQDNSLENVGGSYTWTKTDEAEVIMNDDTHCTMRIAENSKKHNKAAVYDIYVVETNMYYVLEVPGGED